jgi:hypothetical protein
MASHAHGPDDSGPKITLYGSIATALIGAAAVIIVGVLNNNGPTTLSNEAPLDTGLKFSPILDGKLTVSGSAQKDVNGMYVLIGPKPSGRFDVGCGNVLVNRQWQAEVATDPSWQKYPLRTIAAYGSCPGATTLASAFKFTFQPPEPTTSPPPPPDQILDCAVQFGPNCFTGPGFGPPSVYQPSQ